MVKQKMIIITTMDELPKGCYECPLCHCQDTCQQWDLFEPKDEQREYEAAIKMMEHNIQYEPTYNPEDGSL